MYYSKVFTFLMLLLVHCNLQAETPLLNADSVGYLNIHGAGKNRTVQDRLQEKISVRDFGAKGDGTSDDSAAFHEAFNASLYVTIPPGTYRVSNLLPVRGLTIEADGAVIMGVSDDDSIFLTGCILRMLPGSNNNEQQNIIQQFESEFESKKEECAVLIVHSTSSPDKWTIAGFDDKGEFKRILIDDSSSALSVNRIEERST